MLIIQSCCRYRRSFRILFPTSSKSLTTTSNTNTNETKSKRQQFRDIVPDKRMLDYLDRLGLGYLTKRQQRISLAKKFSNENRPRPRPHDNKSSFQNLGPYPFDKVGKLMTKVSNFKDIPTTTWMHTKRSNDIKVLYDPPEVAIIGRSNVGKSTLLNSLVGFDDSFTQSSPVSEKPGETQELHFYGVGRVRVTAPISSPIQSTSSNDSYNVVPALLIVDMPGYGFAFMNEEDKTMCDNLCCQYLLQRGKALKKVILLVDARHGLKITDKLFFKTLMDFHNNDSNKDRNNKKNDKIKWTLQLVFTKCDLVERMELVRRIQITRETLDEMLPRFTSTLHTLAVSSKENKGILELQKELVSLIPSVMPENHHHWYARTSNNNEIENKDNSTNSKNNNNDNDNNNKRNDDKTNARKRVSTSFVSRNNEKYKSSSLSKQSTSSTRNGFLKRKMVHKRE